MVQQITQNIHNAVQYICRFFILIIAYSPRSFSSVKVAYGVDGLLKGFPRRKVSYSKLRDDVYGCVMSAWSFTVVVNIVAPMVANIKKK